MHPKKQESPDEEEDSAVKTMREAGLTELESCTGVGLNYCILRYKKGNWCIRLVTQGEYAPAFGSPKVQQWKKYRCNTDAR